MEIELVIWYDNVSGVTHICKVTDTRSVHITPQSANGLERNIIVAMCNTIKDLYER